MSNIPMMDETQNTGAGSSETPSTEPTQSPAPTEEGSATPNV